MTVTTKFGHTIAILMLAGSLAGCAGEVAEQLFVQPGRFDYFSCEDLVSARQKSAERERELKILIDRAEKEPVGVVLAAASYRGEYQRVQTEQKMQTEVMARKNCAPDTPPRASEPSSSKTHSRHR